MTRSLLAALSLVLVLTACGGVRESGLNPFNWFGRDRSEPVAASDVQAPQNRRPLVSSIVGLQVDPTPEGAIIRAIGLPPTQGYWDAGLVRVPSSDPSVLAFDFRALPPVNAQPQGTERSREILAGRAVSSDDLEGIRTIVVNGNTNRRSVRR
ncbi:hypothetical protein [Litoreibacter roseus]|uniref:Uncharacterized protein n=1 Tax=Litoreibacter roseus TaxID=2601869 RepID=A0A6N6JFG9_9RHOB|nr:hypothetical protein [Litoreibacter roseus]GFE64119.1 hypothetical protein KIN_11930 [Litoreibacter roseus]